MLYRGTLLKFTGYDRNQVCGSLWRKSILVMAEIRTAFDVVLEIL
jgi:hypothetical protein